MAEEIAVAESSEETSEEISEGVSEETSEEISEETSEESTEDGEESSEENQEGEDAAGEAAAGEATQVSDEYELNAYGQIVKIKGVDKLRDLAEKGLGADAKFEESNQQNRKLVKVIENLKEKPFEVLESLVGAEQARKITEDYVYEQLQKEQMDERDRKIYEQQKKLETYEKKQQQEQESKKQQELAAEVEKLKEEYETQFISALEESKLPHTTQIVSRMARYMEEAVMEGLNPTATEVAALVKQDIQEEAKSILGSMDPEKLREVLGDEPIKKIKQYELGKIKSPTDGNKVEDASPARGIKTKKRSKSEKQLKEELDKLYGDPFGDDD